MSEGQKRALSIRERAGRVAVFLCGTGMAVFAVLTMVGVVVWKDGAGEPMHSVLGRVALGSIYLLWGLAFMGGAIFGLPDASHRRRRRARNVGGDIDLDIDGD